MKIPGLYIVKNVTSGFGDVFIWFSSGRTQILLLRALFATQMINQRSGHSEFAGNEDDFLGTK